MKRIFLITLFIVLLPLSFYFFIYLTKAAPIKANIVIDTKQIIGPFPDRFKALAQGGEEVGTPMLHSVVPQVSALYINYIRLDHIYDAYDLVSRQNNNLVLNFTKLDQTVCDIYHTGAKPFFALSYMPPVMRSGSDTSAPTNWNEWAGLVQKTIEHYSGNDTRLCGGVYGDWMKDIYYEVWNEPDLFGHWGIYGGSQDYLKLYFYSSLGANQAQNVQHFYLGGPVTTKIYRNWIQKFLQYATTNHLRVDFLSWHHYATDVAEFSKDTEQLNSWLAADEFAQYRTLPRIVSEWGFDSNYNPEADTARGAAHTISAIREFSKENIKLAFLFEVKDGLAPSWGILTHDGIKKPRYDALLFLNSLTGNQLTLQGEGTFVTGFATSDKNITTVILSNYDSSGKNSELVPITFTNLDAGIYTLTTTYLDGRILKTPSLEVQNGQLQRLVLMPLFSVAKIELLKQ